MQITQFAFVPYICHFSFEIGLEPVIIPLLFDLNSMNIFRLAKMLSYMGKG